MYDTLLQIWDFLLFLVYSLQALIDYVFTEYLLLSNIISASVLLAFGDFLVQIMETRILHSRRRGNKRYNHTRTRHVMVVGMVSGVFNHIWYQSLELLITSNTLSAVLKKIALDQAIAGPFFSSCFIVGMGIMERKNLNEIHAEWSSKFWHIYKADWMFWPAAQFINFYLVPQRFRVLHVNVATLIWNTFLSYARHQEAPVSSSRSSTQRRSNQDFRYDRRRHSHSTAPR